MKLAAPSDNAHSGAAAAAPAPAAQSRFVSLDFLRGCAVMGILAMNIVAFAMPEIAYINPAAYGAGDGGNITAWLFGFLFFDGKMRGLFSLLFGASMMIVIMQMTERGEDPTKRHYARMFWLAIFGLLHFFLIWWGDILFSYAAAGSVAYLFHHLSSRSLIKWGLILYAAAFLTISLASGAMLYTQYRAYQPGASATEIRDYRVLIEDTGYGQAAIDRDLAVHRGSYAGILDDKLTEKLFDPLLGIIGVLLETLPFMLIGMAMAQNGFITGQAKPQTYRRFAIWGFGGGLILTALCAAVNIRTAFDPVTVMVIEMNAAMPARLLMTVGYAALLILFIRRFSLACISQHISAAGRVAFTNYIGTSVCMTAIFYGYGFGLYGQVSRPWLYGFVLCAWAVMLLWSKPWLAHFHYGPLEWLWRSLARGRLQPLRRVA
ncbi:DUF418 domain-containing protein [Sphingorhabdus arenilitoris]|uniref:DUF418 domain-containing protein n=1 Tax=Sphingorhabdus arenilitoris TaxID=1490041 RepID=A0ABV8RJZ1_9SPHN